MTLPDGASLVPLLHEAGLLTPGLRLAGGSPAIGDAVAEVGLTPAEVLADPLPALAGAALDAVLLLDAEVAAAGPTAPVLVAAAVAACRPGGLVAIAAPSLHGNPGAELPSASAAHMRQLLSERGLSVELLAAPGASARLAGRPWGGAADLEQDRIAGLLDAGPVVLAAGRTPPDEGERSRRFFAQLPRKVVAASVLVADAQRRILVVFDSFRQQWTLPGGLVDPDELPSDGAAREAAEEGGVDVTIGALLGIFCHAHPDRLHLVYEGLLRSPTPRPIPLHPHEVDEARWIELDEASQMLPPGMWSKVRRCVDEPGQTWRD